MKVRKKRWWIIGGLLVLIIGVRLALPYIIKDYVNKKLSELEGYDGHVDDIDLHLYRGAYVIKGLEIVKTEGQVPVPFVDIERIGLSVDWKALFKGSIVGEIILLKPKLNFVGSKEEGETQSGEDADWTKTIKDLMPLKINRFEINQGSISFLDFSTEPKVNLYLNNLNLIATNLNNAEDINNKLPSTVTATATSLGQGDLKLDMQINMLKQIPDFDANLEFTKVNLPSLNQFSKAYGKFDFEKGTFSLFTELILSDGKITGYLKPFFEEVKILDWEKEEGNFLQKSWEAVVGLTKDIFENKKKDHVATRIPIEGTVDEINTKVLPTVWNVFRHAFIKAFDQQLEGTLSEGSGIGLEKGEDDNDKKDDKKKKS